MSRDCRTELTLAADEVPEDDCCLKCRFWESEKTTNDFGSCRRRSPSTRANRISEWPETGYWEWCGEFEAGRWMVTYPAAGEHGSGALQG